jgi:hypothetical protein
MSDQDRGAYTPQTDAPLAFDARAPRGGRKPLPVALIGSGVVLLVLVAGIAMYYRNGTRPAGGAPAVVGQPVATMKAAPDPNQVAQEVDPAEKLDVYKAPGATTAAPSFAPPPEAPQPRPAPGLTVQTVENAPIHSAPGTPAPPAKPPVAVAAAPIAPAATPPAAKPAAVAAAPAPKPATVAAAPGLKPALSTPAPTAAPATGGTLVQIGAYSSAALADKGWSDLAKAYPGPMSGKSKRVEPLERDGKTLFRTSVGGWATRAQAQAFCEQMKAAGRACIVKG